MVNATEITDGITSGIESRQQRGLAIATTCNLKPEGGCWLVPSQSGASKYAVWVNPLKCRCTCPDFETRGCKCKHIYAVEYTMRREENADGSVTVTETISATKRTTYKQNWPAYNEAQTNEKNEFQTLLFDLCKSLPPEAPRKSGKGRPRLPLSDAVFFVTFKIYSTFSGRRFISDLGEAQAKGYVTHTPHFNSIFNYLENPALTPILTDLITRSSAPLAAIESDFAADSSGFMTSRFTRWYDQKYGVVRQKADWVKAHLMCGVKTNVVTAVEIHDQHANDAPVLPSLVDTTAKNFTMSEVSADKGYLSTSNMQAIEKHGATPFIVFKINSQAGNGSMWDKMFHFFSFKRQEFLNHYHKRSNVESTFMMVKAKFGDAVRSKTDTAMKNEVLCKIFCHNICCLISAMYELGIEPEF